MQRISDTPCTRCDCTHSPTPYTHSVCSRTHTVHGVAHGAHKVDLVHPVQSENSRIGGKPQRISKRQLVENGTVRIVHANLRGYTVGESWWCTQFPDATVAQARELHAQGLGYARIAKITGANWATVRDWVKHRRRKPPVRLVVRVQTRGSA